MTKLKLLFRKYILKDIGVRCGRECQYNLSGRCYRRTWKMENCPDYVKEDLTNWAE